MASWTKSKLLNKYVSNHVIFSLIPMRQSSSHQIWYVPYFHNTWPAGLAYESFYSVSIIGNLCATVNRIVDKVRKLSPDLPSNLRQCIWVSIPQLLSGFKGMLLGSKTKGLKEKCSPRSPCIWVLCINGSYGTFRT